MFHHGNISARAPFGAADIPADGHFNMGTFRRGDFSAWGLFGMRNFQHRNISARGHFGTWTFRHSSTGAEMSVPKRPYYFARCQNIHVPKCSGAKISLSKMSPCGNVPKLKRPSNGMSAGPKGAYAEMFPWSNIHAEMISSEMSGAEMVGSLFISKSIACLKMLDPIVHRRTSARS